ncbi:MAG TPA: cupin-like domain-containing protein [Burkholderiaceae bacterium]
MLGKRITESEFRAALRQAEQAPRWLDIDADAMRGHYNRTGFQVRHRLAEHPLFTADALFKLARRMPVSAVKYRFGSVPGNTHFDSSIERFRGDLTLDDALDHLVEKRAYVALYNPEKDPEYGPVIEGLLAEIGLAARPYERLFNWYSTYVFISAHDAVTPYHMDREMNFLLQIAGRKTVQLWDPRDDAVMRPEQRDHLFSFDADARPAWHEGLPARARVFELEPGLGVHHPFIAPHLVTTGQNFSISLAITYRTPHSDVMSDAHAFNDRMRPYGLGRIPVGSHPVVDVAKAYAMRGVRAARQALHRGERRDKDSGEPATGRS